MQQLYTMVYPTVILVVPFLLASFYNPLPALGGGTRHKYHDDDAPYHDDNMIFLMQEVTRRLYDWMRFIISIFGMFAQSMILILKIVKIR